MSLEIVVGGADITDDVIIEEARFTMANGPNPGDFEFRVKDAAKTYAFRAGQPCQVDFDGVRVFEGFVLLASQGHGFPVDDSVTAGPGPVERLWTLKGVDLNILFRKRVIFDQADPSATPDLELAAGTSDLTYLSQIIDHLTLDDDNLTFDFNHVGSPNPDKKGNSLSTGDLWEKVMAQTAALPGAIWGIRPPRTVYYEDDDTETAPFAISDDPDQVSSFGYANFEWLNDGSKLVNDARIWGVGLGTDHLTFAHVRDEASVAEHGRWENGNGWRYNLYRQTSVNLVTNSLVYGSPQNLHGAKDDSMVVTCRIKRPGLMPGHKVRIISTVFGEEIVLPLRRYTITFVNPNDALFDLDLSWEVDAPLSLFDYPPLPEIVLPPPPPPPDPCDDLGFATGWIDSSFGWEVVRSHPWLGKAGWFGNAFEFYPMTRYNQTWGNIFLGDRGDGINGARVYTHARSQFIVPPTRWAIQIDFSIPSYSMILGYHMAPFPQFDAGLWWGGQSNDVYPKISLDIQAFGSSKRIVDIANGINHVAATGYFNSVHVSQGTRWHYELYSNGQSRGWPHGGVKPVSATSGILTASAPAQSDEPWDQEVYGPNRPWRVAIDGGTDSTIATANYIFMRAQVEGGDTGGKSFDHIVLGNPTATDNTIRDNFNSFTTGATVSGQVTGYHDELANRYAVTIPINDFRFITLPDDFNFATEVPVNCVEIETPPEPGSYHCESLRASSDTEYTTTWPFAVGSTLASLEGVEQRLGIDYDEDAAGGKIVFRSPVFSSALLYVCYQMVS